MKQQTFVQRLLVLLSIVLTVMLIQGMAPVQTASAQETTSTSDLSVSLVSIPNQAKACDVFQAIYTVTNLGPDPAYDLSAGVNIPDAYNDIAYLRVPYSLAVGETATFSVVIWVGGFEPGETRHAWVRAGVRAPATSLDPNLDNNLVRKEMKITGPPVINCLPRYE